MVTENYFEQLKNRLLDKKWIAIPLFVVTVLASAVKIWKDVVPGTAERSQPTAGGDTVRSQVGLATDARLLVERELRPIYFLMGSFDLTEEAAERLALYSELLRQQDYKTLVLESHTRPVHPLANLDLAGARARTIREALVRLGIPKEKISVIKFGGEEANKVPAEGYADRVALRIIWR